MSNQEQSNKEFLENLQEIIHKNLEKPDFSIVQICIEMNISRAQLHRKVKAATGLSTSLLIRHVRMEQAKKLLETTDFNVSEIAYQIGISSPQNFSKYFIEAYGVSPSAYRKQRGTPLAEAFQKQAAKRGALGAIGAGMCSDRCFPVEWELGQAQFKNTCIQALKLI